MVNVASVHRNIVERADIMSNRKSEHAHHQHGGEESERCQEQTFAPRFVESVVIDPIQSGMRNNRAQAAENSSNDDRQNPEAAVSPKHSQPEFRRQNSGARMRVVRTILN